MYQELSDKILRQLHSDNFLLNDDTGCLLNDAFYQFK